MTYSGILKSALVGVLGLLLQAGTPTEAVAQTASATDSLVVLPSLDVVLAQSRAFAPHILSVPLRFQHQENHANTFSIPC